MATERFCITLDDDAVRMMNKAIESSSDQEEKTNTSKFISEAVKFYAGFLISQNADVYLPAVITSTVKGSLNQCLNRQDAKIKTLSYQVAILSEIIASTTDGLDDETMTKLRNKCIKLVNDSEDNVIDYSEFNSKYRR